MTKKRGFGSVFLHKYEAFVPREIEARSVCFNEDIGAVLTALLQA